MKTRAARLARRAVVESSDWPLLGRAYRAVYALQIERIRRELAHVRDVDAVLLRGSSRRDIDPGLSDIDLVVVPRAGLDPDQELVVVDAVARSIRKVNVGAPLIRDVHIVTREELEHWARLPVYLLGAIHVDATPLVGSVALPACAGDPELVEEALLRGVAWWTDRALRQLVGEPGAIGQRLASRSLSKAAAFADAIRSGQRDLLQVMRTYNRGPRLPADEGAAIDALATFDAVIPDARIIDDGERAPHPVIEALADPLRRWSAPMFAAGQLTAVVLSVEGACEHDLRLYLVIDPENPGAVPAFKRLTESLRAAPPLPRDRFTRTPTPLVVSPRQLERSVFLRWTALEPVVRGRLGVVLHGVAPPPRAASREIARSLAYDLMHAATRMREMWRLSFGTREAAQWLDAAYGVIPEARALLVGAAPPTRLSVAQADLRSLVVSRTRRAALYATVRDAARELVPALLSLGGAP